MKILKILLFFLILIAFGCKNNNSSITSKEKKEVIKKDLKDIIDDYIKINPLKSNRIIGKSSVESNTSYPSYHIYFKKNEKDTVFSIVQFPDYHNFELEGVSNEDEKDTVYRSINHKGWIMYKDKYPLIIFDDNNYSKRLIQVEGLTFKIPDSLKAGTVHVHVKFIKWDYQIENGNLIRKK